MNNEPECPQAQLNPIPVAFVVDQAQQKAAGARRAPYVELIQKWADHEQQSETGQWYVQSLTGEQSAVPGSMPKGVCQRYRQGEKAEQLISLVRKIDETVVAGLAGWTWAHVMRVMIDDHIIDEDLSVREFERLIRALVPGKKDGSVRRKDQRKFSDLIGTGKPCWQEMPADTTRDICWRISQRLRPLTYREKVLK